MVAESVVSYRYMAGARLQKVKAGKKQMAVSWKVRKGASGYQVVYSTNKNMSKAVKKYVSGGKKKSVTIKNLKSGTKYYVKLRPYKSKSKIKYIGTVGRKLSVKVK